MINDRILTGMAKAFFASAYADQADENDSPLSGEIMDQLPSEVDPAAIHAAETLYWQFEQALQGQGNGITLDGAYVWLHGVEAMEGDTDDEKARLFGHYAAMQAMGHGVGLWEYAVAPQIEERVPYIEFGSHSLERDYFEDNSEE